MLLDRPMEALIAPDQARVLTVLHRAGVPLSGRTIATLTESVSQSTVSRLLTGLTDSGLVLRVPGGYSINRDHLAYRAIETLVDTTAEFRRRVGDLVGGWTADPVTVVLFGSTARREAGPNSDIDLLVIRPDGVEPDDQQWADDVASLAERVQLWTGTPCEVLEYDAAGFDRLGRDGDPLFDTIQRDGITLAGTDLRTTTTAVAS